MDAAEPSYRTKLGSFATGLSCGFLAIPLGRLTVERVTQLFKPERVHEAKSFSDGLTLQPLVRLMAPPVYVAAYVVSTQLTFYHSKSKVNSPQDNKPFMIGALCAGASITTFRCATEIIMPIVLLYPRFWLAAGGLVLRDSLAIYPLMLWTYKNSVEK